MNLNRKVIAVLATSFALVAPLALKADPLGLGVLPFASGGTVVATYVSGDAANTDVLFLGIYDPVFSNHFPPLHTNPGDKYTFPLPFAVNTLLDFGIHNISTGKTYYVGDGLGDDGATANPDGIAHAAVTDLGGGVTQIEFEDLFNGGDKDYNDVIFTFINVSVNKQNSVPDATGTAGLMLAGLALVGAAAFKRRR
jgi:MYXO-CTERM domain-containing protein